MKEDRAWSLRITLLMALVACSCGGSGGSSKPATPPADVVGSWTVDVATESDACPPGMLEPAAPMTLSIQQAGGQIGATDGSGGAYSGTISGAELFLVGGWTVEKGGGCILAVVSAIHGTVAGESFSATDTLVAAPTDATACPGLASCSRMDRLAGRRSGA